MNQEKIGKFISLSRKNKRLTQEQLAEKLGVSINAVSKWERGLNLPDVSLMEKLCEVLDFTLNELFAGEKLTNEEMVRKSEKNIMSLMMTLKQLRIVEVFTQILIGVLACDDALVPIRRAQYRWHSFRILRFPA